MDDFLILAKDHYWDSLEPHRELILKHIESLVALSRLTPVAGDGAEADAGDIVGETRPAPEHDG